MKYSGARIKMSPKRLRQQILPSDADNIYIRIRCDDELIGNVFATRWIHENRELLWITQLCVHSDYRNRGIAKMLLRELRGDEYHAVGILSSHPFAVSAVLRVFGRGVEEVDLSFIKECARDVMESCPVVYVRDAKLVGGLFTDEMKAMACADTGFWVDHGEPNQALRLIEEKGVRWPLGDLPEGCEFLGLVETIRRSDE